MKLAALYSGGKDSTMAMYLAEQMGHSVGYIVNIVPNSDDSMMFHVPNANMVPLLAEAMGRKLVTAPTDGNEEDDLRALRKALKGLDVEGIVTGAIWSDYQWDRINAVCEDLGLICLSPLWRKDQDTVLKEIIDSGISAMIVGVYADGLDGTWLGRSIADSYDDLKRTVSKNKMNIAGEGGEYETLTVDSPIQSSRLVAEVSEKEWNGHSGTMRIRRARLEKKIRSHS